MDSANAFGEASNKGEAPMKDEIAAVEAELKAMQERLAELKAKAEGVSQAQAGSEVRPPQPEAQRQEQPEVQRPPQSYQQPSYAYQQQAYTYQPPVQPFYDQHQSYAQPIAYSKDHVAAGLLAIFLGSLGIHKFYLGYNTSGFVMLALTILGSLFTFGIAAVAMAVVSIIEGILYLTKSQTEFEQIYVFNKKEWF